jgi:hypothetical protein
LEWRQRRGFAAPFAGVARIPPLATTDQNR